MMERNDGLRAFLSSSLPYKAFQALVGRKGNTDWVCDHHWRTEKGMKVLDIGCGPATLRSHLEENIEYFGFDPNKSYIERAKDSEKGIFLVGEMKDFLSSYRDRLEGKIDLVICSGVLHHLSDAQLEEVLVGSLELLAPNGRFAALEPAKLVKQEWMSHWVVSQDRGMNVKYDFEWNQLMKHHFSNTEISVLTGLLRIPYTHVLLTGWK